MMALLLHSVKSSAFVGQADTGPGLYLLFSIMHDALHRNVSTNRRLNEIFGRISLLLLIPAAPSRLRVGPIFNTTDSLVTIKTQTTSSTMLRGGKFPCGGPILICTT
jgi:hypothetical protein